VRTPVSCSAAASALEQAMKQRIRQVRLDYKADRISRQEY
jgi:hypothetical protein